jgi:hypothetical protein
VHADQPLSSVEAFALALVEASSRLTVENAAHPRVEREPHEADASLRDTVGAE